MENYSVVIVEDHMLLSQAIGNIVDSFGQFKLLYLCGNGKELTEKFSSPQNIPDVVLMDINMPIMNGIETTQWISKNYPQVNVLALSVEDDETTVLKMIRAGAKGYLLKDTEKSILEGALLDVMKNGFYHTKNVTNLLLKSFNEDEPDNSIRFKEREIIFIKLSCTELTYKEIAGEMNLSPKTIDNYRTELFGKLNVKNRIGLAMYAIKNKIYIP
jgi:DNA-binding NarL/FixJ family response regulator